MGQEGLDAVEDGEGGTFVEKEAKMMPSDIITAPPQEMSLTALVSFAISGEINTPNAQLRPYPTHHLPPPTGAIPNVPTKAIADCGVPAGKNDSSEV